MYLAGYAIECLLKSKLMAKFQCRNLVELEEELRLRGQLSVDATIFTHQLELLLRFAGGTDRIRKNPQLWKQFKIVNEWVPAWRYAPDHPGSHDAEDFLLAVDDVRHWIDANV
jgi:hypothetical protein